MGVTLGLVFLSLVGLTHGTSCSEANRTADLSQCLLDISVAGLKDDTFWFGDQYDIDCPLGSVGTECINLLSAKSIFTRVFHSGFDTDNLDRYLKMEFTSPPGNYTGCGNTYTFDSVWTQTIDPLADTVVTPWYVRFLPHLEWTYSQDEKFTLVVYDVGNLYLHGVYTNIMGNDVIGSEHIKPYHGPQTTGSKKNPYVFMIFKQAHEVNISEDWRTLIEANQAGNFSFSDFQLQYNLTGPVAINWIVATGDVYAAQRMLDLRILNRCPNYIARDLNKMERPFLSNTTTLTVSVNVKFTVTPTEFKLCCGDHKYEQETFDLNPLGNPIYDTYKTSQTPAVTLLKKGLYFQANNFADDKYVLITLDPDVPITTVGTEERPLLHWLVYNIQNGIVSGGTEYAGYKGPQPSDRQTHYYYFLLYKQAHSLSEVTILNYAGDNCVERLVKRCLFNINAFVAEQNLTLVGASWMTGTTDIYVAKRKLGDGPNTNEWCQGMPGYGGDPTCPVGASTRTVASFVLMIFTLVLLQVS